MDKIKDNNFPINIGLNLVNGNYVNKEDIISHDNYVSLTSLPSNNQPIQYINTTTGKTSKNYMYYHNLETMFRILKPNLSIALLHKIINIIESKSILEAETEINLLIMES